MPKTRRRFIDARAAGWSPACQTSSPAAPRRSARGTSGRPGGAGEDAWAFCEAELESPSSGAVFTAAVRAIGDKRNDRLDRLFALVAAQPEIRNGLVSAFGWTERQELRGLVAELLGSGDPLRRYVGIAACALHRVDPGLIPARRYEDADTTVRARAWRTVGELGKRELRTQRRPRLQASLKLLRVGFGRHGPQCYLGIDAPHPRPWRPWSRHPARCARRPCNSRSRPWASAQGETC